MEIEFNENKISNNEVQQTLSQYLCDRVAKWRQIADIAGDL